MKILKTLYLGVLPREILKKFICPNRSGGLQSRFGIGTKQWMELAWYDFLGEPSFISGGE